MRGFDNDIKITQPGVCILLSIWHSFSFASSKACPPSLKKLLRTRGFLTHCRARAAVQRDKDVCCSSGRQLGCAGEHLGQGTDSAPGPASWSPPLVFQCWCWEMSCSAAPCLPDSSGGTRTWVFSGATDRDGVKPAACIWLMWKAGDLSREHRQRGRDYRSGKSLQCGDGDSLGCDKGVCAPSNRHVIQLEWQLQLCSAFTLSNNYRITECSGLAGTSVDHLVQPLCRSRVTYSRLHRTLSRQVLNISRERESTASLGSLFQCSVTLRGKKFFLMFSWNFLCFSLCPLPLVLSLGTT